MDSAPSEEWVSAFKHYMCEKYGVADFIIESALDIAIDSNLLDKSPEEAADFVVELRGESTA